MIKQHSNGSAAGRSSIGNGAASKNGAARYQSDKVRVAIVGVGNCASAFVQGVHYYRDADPNVQVPGLMHVDLGGYHVRDIEFTAAFNIDSTGPCGGGTTTPARLLSPGRKEFAPGASSWQ